jgi:Translation initiation factor IF-2, N-terminal region
VTKRVYQIADEQGVSSKEVLEALSAAGVEAKAAASNVDEEVALRALEDAGERQAPIAAPPEAEHEDEFEPPPAAEPEPIAQEPASFEELAAEAERLAGPAPAGEPAPELAPPDWVIDEEPAEITPEPEPEPDPEPDPEPVAATAPEDVPEGSQSLATVEFEDLRGLGMSVTQAKRVLRYRDERGFTSVDELDAVPGFPKAFLSEVKDRLVP